MIWSRYGEATATAELAALVAAAPPSAYNISVVNVTFAAAVATKFRAVAADIQKLYLEMLWSEKLQHFAVWKADTKNHSALPPPPPSPSSELIAIHLLEERSSHPPTDGRVSWGCGAGFFSYWGYQDIHQNGNCSSNHWACDELAEVRELFSLSSPWYFGLVPPSGASGAKYEAGWKLLTDRTAGYGGAWGLRTAARDSTGICSAWDQGNSSSWLPTGGSTSCQCYNHTHGECAWDGSSWPYESARVPSISPVSEAPTPVQYTCQV